MPRWSRRDRKQNTSLYAGPGTTCTRNSVVSSSYSPPGILISAPPQYQFQASKFLACGSHGYTAAEAVLESKVEDPGCD